MTIVASILNCNIGSQNELSNETSDRYFLNRFSELYHLIQNQVLNNLGDCCV